jgi:hypothetical protein
MSRVIAVIACGFTVAACSASTPSLNFFDSSPSAETVGTISVRTETVRFESKPPGAEVKISGVTCRTPCELSVQAAPEISATFALRGYQPQTISVRQEPNSPKLAPNPVFVELRAAPAGAGKKHLKKKRPAVAARANSPVASAAPATPPAASAAAPVSSPAPDAAPSATKYPWPNPPSAK